MALNLARSRQRRLKVKEKANQHMAALNAQKSESDPARKIEQRELWEKVDQAIATLADAEREIFLLYWFGELSYAEISQMTGVSVSAAKVRVHRALGRLSKMLEGLR
jgi:RNA polymerase sigma-70 factor (ECF subfamily)